MSSHSRHRVFAMSSPRRVQYFLVLALVPLLALLACRHSPSQNFVLVGGAGPALGSQVRLALRRAPMRAEIADAELVGEDDEQEEDEEEEPVASSDVGFDVPSGWAELSSPDQRKDLEPLLGLWHIGKKDGKPYPPEAIDEPPYDETPSDMWYSRRNISKEKVNMYFFNYYKAPKSKFPHNLRPGDTLRVYFRDPAKGGERLNWWKTRERYFDGVALTFRGEYHARNVLLRSMVGKGDGVVGYEMLLPLHSPLITKIEVLRRGYIGRNKNAFFLRGMIGKKNQVPLDKDRTALDELYASLREEGRDNEIPEPDYPQTEWDRLPWAVARQDEPTWDEAKYEPSMVDVRSDFDRRVIGGWRRKSKPGKKYGRRGR